MSVVAHVADGADHVQSHVDAAARVVGAAVRQPAHAEVAVAQQLDPEAVVLLDRQRNTTIAASGNDGPLATVPNWLGS